MSAKRFSKALALWELDAKAARIAAHYRFDRGNGTSQLHPKTRMSDNDIDRAVAYGKMRALEEFASSIQDGFSFEGQS